VRSTDDLLRVPNRDFRFLRDEELVRLLVLHRTRGDHARAKEAWDQLVENVYDRVRTRVAAWHWEGKDVRIPAEDVEDVTQLAIIRLGGIMENFEGGVLPQFRAFALTCTAHACMDWARSEMRREMGIAGSIEDRRDGEEDTFGRFDADLARLAEEIAERDEERLEAHDAVANGIPQIPSGDQRIVVEMTLDGLTTAEIAAHLDTSHDNVYQLRRRGLQKLKEVLGDGLC
jgi:RNA polymerase sigma factor (sigma-70 family)